MGIRIFLCGDVMTGRGVDQVLPHPGDPRIQEASARSADLYVWLAEQANGPIPRPVDFAYIWGDALPELSSVRPQARIINLETSITRSDDFWPGKGVHYRMHPDNVPCIPAAGVDVCVLANNHVLDYGHAGLVETLEVLAAAGVGTAGAGRTLAEARAPAVIDVAGEGRVLVFGCGAESSGIPPSWAAGPLQPGVHLLEDLSDRTVERFQETIASVRRPRDVVVVSIHWGSNWGFDVPGTHVRFAHALVRAGVDLVHGHSSHHVRPLEVVEGRLVLYGCGDFLNDYEGITGYEEFRDDLALMYFPTVDPLSGRLAELPMTPMQIRNFRLNRASRDGAEWLEHTLDRESRAFGVRVQLDQDGRLRPALLDEHEPPLDDGDLFADQK